MGKQHLPICPRHGIAAGQALRHLVPVPLCKQPENSQGRWAAEKPDLSPPRAAPSKVIAQSLAGEGFTNESMSSSGNAAPKLNRFRRFRAMLGDVGQLWSDLNQLRSNLNNSVVFSSMLSCELDHFRSDFEQIRPSSTNLGRIRPSWVRARS